MRFVIGINLIAASPVVNARCFHRLTMPPVQPAMVSVESIPDARERCGRCFRRADAASIDRANTDRGRYVGIIMDWNHPPLLAPE